MASEEGVKWPVSGSLFAAFTVKFGEGRVLLCVDSTPPLPLASAPS